MNRILRAATFSLVAAFGLTACFSADTGTLASSGPAATTTTTIAEDPLAAVELVSTAVPVEAASEPPIVDIRDVDFLNGMMFIDHNMYDTDEGDEGDGELLGPVVDGEFTTGEFSDGDFFGLFVNEPVFVDFDSDGQEEAVLAAATNGGGSGYFSELRSFAVDDDDEVKETSVSFYGDRAFGGISQVVADDDGRAVIVDVFTDGEGACCAHTITQQRVGMIDGQLTVIESFEPMRYTFLQSGSLANLSFIPGTSAVMLDTRSSTDLRVGFDGWTGQVVEVADYTGLAISGLEMTHLGTGQTTQFDGQAELPSDGSYELSISLDNPAGSNDGELRSTMLFTIHAGEPEAETTEPAWTITERTEVVRTDPVEIAATASVPVFPDYPNATSAISQFVADQFDPWVTYAREAEIPRDDGNGSFELTPTVTLSSPSLVSVEFGYFEYLCCRPYPNHGSVAIVLDPVTGEVLADEDIVDVSRSEEIEQIWFDAFAVSENIGDSENVEAADWFEFLGSSPRWSAISVTSEGLIFATDRSGALPGTNTFVPFEDLGLSLIHI